MHCFKQLNNRMPIAASVLLASLVLAIGTEKGLGQQPVVTTATQRRAAIFVFNREPKISAQQVKILEDAISARVASEGFITLTRDVILDSISRSMKQPELAGESKANKTETTSFFEDLRNALKSKEPVAKSLEDQLDEQSSVMRLAQTLGADMIVIAVTESFGTERTTFKGNDLAPVPTTTVVNNLRVSYRLVFAASGGAVEGDTLLVTRTWRRATV